MNTSNTSPSLRFVDADTVARTLPFAELIEALRKAFAATDLVAPARNHYGLNGLATGSVMVGPVRTEAGLWAVLEVWSDFRDAFTPHDVKLMDKVVAALAKKTPAA